MLTGESTADLLSAFYPDDYLYFSRGIQDAGRCDREVASVVRLLDMRNCLTLKVAPSARAKPQGS